MTRKDLREARCIQLFEATIGSIAYNGFAKTTLNLARRACRDFLARTFPRESSAAMALSTAA
jgi:hypothetical protein